MAVFIIKTLKVVSYQTPHLERCTKQEDITGEMLVDTVSILAPYLRIIDMVKFRALCIDSEWNWDVAMVVAQQLCDARLITRGTMQSLQRYDPQAVIWRIWNLCLSSKEYRGKCPECLKAYSFVIRGKWMYCNYCIKYRGVVNGPRLHPPFPLPSTQIPRPYHGLDPMRTRQCTVPLQFLP